jgi:hypothetical protein
MRLLVHTKNPRHSGAEIEDFGRLHLEYRYGYHFVAHDRLSRKNVLGGLEGVPQKTVHMVYMRGPQNRFFQFYRGRDVKTPTNYIYLDST